MTNQSWATSQPVSDGEMAELRAEIAATIDDHDQAHKKATRFQHLKLRHSDKTPHRTRVTDQMRLLRHHRHEEEPGDTTRTPQDVHHGSHTPVRYSEFSLNCDDCEHTHHHEFAPQRFDSVEQCLNAIRDLSCYLDKTPRTIWLALEGIFTDRQSTSAPNLVRHRVGIMARTLPAAGLLFLVALVLLRFLLPEHAATSGYTPVFSELGFLVILTVLTTLTFFCLATAMLLMNSSIQERFLNGFRGLMTWSIPIVLSFFFVSPEFLSLIQDITDNRASLEAIFEQHDNIIETIYWTVVAYVSLYTGTLFAFIAFSKVFQEQRDYAHRHDVLRDVIPILVSESQSPKERS